MEIQAILEELRNRQTFTANKRAEALRIGNDHQAEVYRTELIRLLDLEERLMAVLSETYRALNKQITGIDSPSAYASKAACGKRHLPCGTRLKTTYKGKTIRATVNEDGKIEYQEQFLSSIAALAEYVTGKSKNHLRNRKFWVITMPEK